MLKFVLAVLLVTSLIVAPAGANQIIFFDNLESGLGNWTTGVGSGLPLSTDKAFSGSHSFKEGQTAGSMYHVLSDARMEVGLYAQFMFYDPNAATNVRHYLQIRSYTDPANFGGLNELLAIGSYNATPVNTLYYSGRSAFGGPSWFTLSVNRSVGWHKMRIEVVGDNGTGGANKGLVNYYVNDVLAGENVPFNWQPWNMIVVGSGLSSTNAGDFFYDDIEIGIIPEPTSMLVLGTGLAGLLGVIRRRRS